MSLGPPKLVITLANRDTLVRSARPSETSPKYPQNFKKFQFLLILGKFWMK